MLFIFLVGSSAYFLLKDGVLIDEITFAGLDVEELYIKWDKKLTFYAKRAYVAKEAAKNPSPFTYDTVSDAFYLIRLFEGFVDSVNIEELRIGEAEGRFSYNVGEENLFELTGPRHALKCRIDFGSDYFLLHINRYEDFQRRLTLSGSVVARLNDSEIFARLFPVAGDVKGLGLYAFADRDALTFSLSASEPIRDLAPLVDPFGLPHEISKWIVDYAVGSGVTLKTLHGTLPYKAPEQLLQTLYGEAVYHDLAYTFNQRTEPIRTAYTDVVFADGVLNIHPREGRYYGHDGGESWLKIDFSTHPIILTAYVRTETILDENLLHLLHTYHIDLPFVQTAGTTTGDLTLAVTLANGHTDAEGTFGVTSGVYRFKGTDFDIKDASVALKGADVTIDALHISKPGYIDARVRGEINPVKNEGLLKIDAERVTLGEGTRMLELDQETPWHMDYAIGHSSDTVSIRPSAWRFGEHRFTLEAASFPFDFATGTATLDALPLTYASEGHAKISGTASLFGGTADLQLNVDALRKNSAALAEPMTVRLQLGDTVTVRTAAPSSWKLSGTPLRLGRIDATLADSRLTTAPITFDTANAAGSVALDANMTAGTAFLNLEKLSLRHEGVGTYFDTQTPIAFNGRYDNGRFELHGEALALDLKGDATRWDLALNSLGRLSEHSDLLKRYSLTEGRLHIGHAYGFELFNFDGTVDYPYPVIVQNDVPTGHFDFHGNNGDGRLSFTVNNALHVDIGEKVSVISDGVGYHLGAISKVLAAHSEHNATSATLPDLNLNASNSFLYFTPERRAIADSIRLYGGGDTLNGVLKHRSGMATLELHGESFFLHGSRFGDFFMRHLLSLAKYQGGTMSFDIGGTTEEAHGIVRVQNTTVRDYRLLNNVLAFVNTVPALATFSLPHYSDKGLEVKDAYSSFNYKNGIITIDGVKVDSPELDIAGNGVINYKDETVDLDLNLITRAGTNVGKVPLVGYILVGNEGDVLATLEIKGDLNDPKVSTGIAKGIAVAPFKMLIRTITLPFNLFGKVKDANTTP